MFVAFWIPPRGSALVIGPRIDLQPRPGSAIVDEALPQPILNENFGENLGQDFIESHSVSTVEASTHSHIDKSVSESLALEPAHFCSFEASAVRVHADVAMSRDSSPSRGNFAFIDTRLKPDSVLVVELTALKRAKPVRIILTSKSASRVNSCESLSDLCESTYSPMMESEIPEAWDKLAVRISPSGAVYISHNNRRWIRRMRVDEDLEYHVIIPMENVSVLTLVGMATGLGEIKEEPEAELDDFPAEPRDAELPHGLRDGSAPSEAGTAILPNCVVCLGNEREVAVLPCFHVALCEGCSLSLLESEEPKCPICRASITDRNRVHLS